MARRLDQILETYLNCRVIPVQLLQTPPKHTRKAKHRRDFDRYHNSKAVTHRETWTRWFKLVNGGSFRVIYSVRFSQLEVKLPVLNQLDQPRSQVEIPLLFETLRMHKRAGSPMAIIRSGWVINEGMSTSVTQKWKVFFYGQILWRFCVTSSCHHGCLRVSLLASLANGATPRKLVKLLFTYWHATRHSACIAVFCRSDRASKRRTRYYYINLNNSSTSAPSIFITFTIQRIPGRGLPLQ